MDKILIPQDHCRDINSKETVAIQGVGKGVSEDHKGMRQGRIKPFLLQLYLINRPDGQTPITMPMLICMKNIGTSCQMFAPSLTSRNVKLTVRK